VIDGQRASNHHSTVVGKTFAATTDTLAQLGGDGEPDRPALISADDGSQMTYGELSDRVAGTATALQAIGVRRGARVGLVWPNGPQIIELLLALARIGATAAPLNPAYTKSEFAFYLDDIRPSFVLLPGGGVEAVRSASATAAMVEIACPPGEPLEIRSNGKAVAARTSHEDAGAEDIALLLHTSGTTARPKQVPLLHRNLAASAANVAGHYELTADDVSYCVMPLFHVHGLVASVLAPLAVGGTVVVPRRVSPRRFRGDLRKYGVSWFSAAPTLLRMLLDGASGESRPLPRLRFVRTCSSALPPDLLQRAEAELTVPVLEAYGMTEASHQISSNPLPPASRIPGTVGVAAGAEIRLLDERGAEVPAGATGEVAIRGPGLTPGYLDNPEANAAAFSGTWFRTGDLGSLEGGHLRLSGRLKEMILRGGENISPYEIERVLLLHPAVADAACFGVPSDKYGEEVAAAVELRGEVEEHELVRHCREHLAAYKVPTTIRPIDSVPRTPTGKLQRTRAASIAAPDLVS
jgi:acyl-CoA synthetase (AMP-forming)/AMP-acid ligase II